MQIILMEDDGIFFDGVPQNVVLQVTFDHGKVLRIPYSADKSIAGLYSDLNQIAAKVTVSMPVLNPPVVKASEMVVIPQEDPFTAPKTAKNANKAQPRSISKEDKANVIEKEDIVTIVRLHKREDTFSGTICPLMVGADYRVVQIYGQRHPVTQRMMPESYDLIDDLAATPERMRVFPDEIVLKSKRLSEVIEVTHAIEEILPCPACQVKNSLTLHEDSFHGTCTACNVDIVISRVVKKCQNSDCVKKDIHVSCFDVGGKYEGVCGGCSAKIEVPYA